MCRIALPIFAAGLAAVILVALLLAPQRGGPAMVKVRNVDELSQLFDSSGYTAAGVGDTPVPRILIAALPGDLDAVAVPAERKALFLRVMLPLVLTVNEMVAGDRAQLLALAGRLAAGEERTVEQADWMAALMRRYRVAPSATPQKDLAELLLRVDEVPPSMALAQAALESGWGTSRLARKGNALFGERTWTEAGLTPLAPLPGERHRARSFARLLDAVESYVRNLNTHPAYADFRRERARLRAANEAPQGAVLIRHLVRYSELGSGYTRAVRDLIRANHLQRFDRSALSPSGDTI